jgi:hypothetical protein
MRQTVPIDRLVSFYSFVFFFMNWHHHKFFLPASLAFSLTIQMRAYMNVLYVHGLMRPRPRLCARWQGSESQHPPTGLLFFFIVLDFCFLVPRARFPPVWVFGCRRQWASAPSGISGSTSVSIGVNVKGLMTHGSEGREPAARSACRALYLTF